MVNHLSVIYQWGCSSNGRALAQHARGTGIDAQLLHFEIVLMNFVALGRFDA